MEESPPDEVWHDIMSEIRRAESLVADADRKARDEVVDEMARAVMRRTLETVNEDADASTYDVESSNATISDHNPFTKRSRRRLSTHVRGRVDSDQPVSPSDLQTGIGTRGSIFMN
jgi:hypothetical protein